MTNRYEILEILGQDHSGVCFHATDRETGREVAVRRFFPFGPDGGGLKDEERVAYDVGVQRLMEISHPALRQVLDGGSDPVDGMPFLVTEWLEGEILSERLKDGPLSSESVRAIANLALETSMLLSEAFGEEAVWVETDPISVVVSEQLPERQVTFWISPLRWLGEASERSDLKPLLEMVEDLSGWKNQMISPQSGGGLGGWVRTLRDRPNAWSLRQARAALHDPSSITAPTATTVPSSSQAPVSAATAPPRQQVVFVNQTVVWPWVLSAVLAFGAAGLIAWKQLNPPTPPTPPPASPVAAADPTTSPPKPALPVSQPEPEPEELPETLPDDQPPEVAETLTEPDPPAQPAQEKLRESRLMDVAPGDSGTYTGSVVGAEQSSSGKTRYLELETRHDGRRQQIWAGLKSSDWPDLDLDALLALEGETLRISGTWRTESMSRRKKVLMLRDKEDLEQLESVR